MKPPSAAGGKLPADLRLALEYLQKGNFSGAAQLAHAHLQQHPAEGAAWYLLGTIDLQQGRFGSAQEYFQRAIHCTPFEPALAMCWNGLGHAFAGLGNHQPAQEALRRAARLDPALLQYKLDYAQALITAGQRPSALGILERAVQQHPQDPEPRVRLGNLLFECNRFQEALDLFNHALELDPGRAPVHVFAAEARSILGQSAQARAAYDRALQLDPGLTAYYAFARLGGLDRDPPRIALLEKRTTEGAGSTLAERIDACFALACVHDRAQDYDRAFGYLVTGNRLKRGTFDFSMHTEVQRFHSIMALFDADCMQRFAGQVKSDLAPIFIVGMTRSGSTLLEQMLAAHPAISGCGELPDLGNIALELISKWPAPLPASPATGTEIIADLRSGAERYRRAILGRFRIHGRFTDKMPANFLFLGLIHLAFPHAVIIHTRRNALDTCLSCYEHLFSGQMPYMYDLRELGEYYRLYLELMQHWRTVLPPGRILEVDYETLVADPEQEIRRALAHCGLEFDAHCLHPETVQRPVRTESADQVRQPIYRSAIGRSRNYSAHLLPLAAALDAQP